MDIKVLFTGQREAVIEICDGGKYETVYTYTVKVNGEDYVVSNKSVVSVYGLLPDTDYVISAISEKETKDISIHTAFEYTCLNVKDFGAKGDGVTDDTMAIQCAIMACPKDGRVVVPEGIYKTYPLFLNSNFTLELKKGAVISAFTDREKFPILPANQPANNEGGEYFLGTWEGDPREMFASIITGINASNVVITGEGMLEGNASEENWWFEPKKIRIATRPRMIFLNQCKNVVVQGITIQNSPAWNIHPYFSSDLGFFDLKIKGPKVSPNTDGCNPESCKNVDIVGVLFSVGDDCIAVKSGKIYMGAKYKTPSENINIRRCLMRDGHGAIVLGSEMAGGIKALKCEDCVFLNTDRGLRIKTRRGRGKDAIIDGVWFNNIDMDHVMTPVVINAFYFCDSDGHSDYVQTKTALPVDERTPELGDFLFTNIKATNCHVAASYIHGLPEKPVRSVKFENVDISFAKEMTPGVPAMMDGVDKMTGLGLFAKNIDKLELINTSITGQTGEAIIR